MSTFQHRLNVCGRDVPDIGLARIQLLDLFGIDIQPDNRESLFGDSAAERESHVSHTANSHRCSLFGDTRPQSPVTGWLSLASCRGFAVIELGSPRQIARHYVPPFAASNPSNRQCMS